MLTDLLKLKTNSMIDTTIVWHKKYDMYIKIIYLSLTISCLSRISTQAQQSDYSMSLGANYGTYSMKDMKDIQEYLRFYNQYKFQLLDFKSIVTFPAKFGYEASILRSVNKWKLGLIAWRYSTGARNDYTDYTGFLRTDMIAACNGVGAKATYAFINNIKYQFYSTMHAGVGFNKLTIKEYFHLSGITSEEDEIKFKSKNITVTPGVGYRFLFSDRFFLTTETRYEFCIGNGKLKQYDQDFYLTNNKSEKQEMRWDGFRLCISVGYEF
jgi:hypothetical protein